MIKKFLLLSLLAALALGCSVEQPDANPVHCDHCEGGDVE